VSGSHATDSTRGLVVLGLDPGSLATGWGVVRIVGNEVEHLAHGVVVVRGVAFPERLGLIHRAVATVVTTHAPDEVAVERVFMNRNVEAALKLGQARGAALAAALGGGCPVSEHAATQVKLALTGTGRAEKVQVQHMVREILGLGLPLPADAADALAVAICHAHQRRLNARLVAIGSQGKAPAHANPAAAALLGLRGRRGGRRR
jgi:crossover junction endodeoxyribonuclease RuvC